VHAALEAGHAHFVMAIGRHGDDHSIDLFRNLPMMGKGCATMLPRERGGPPRIRIDHPGELDALARGELVGVVAPHVAGADDNGLQ
jgi:hypothetical protein